jgi:hypothetical protein
MMLVVKPDAGSVAILTGSLSAVLLELFFLFGCVQWCTG